jgi:carbamoyl-phosphate synthase large subunit
MNNNFLISGIGGDIAQALCRILKSHYNNSFLFGIDVNSKHAGTLFVDRFQEIEAAKYEEKYIHSILNIIKDNNINFFIPTSEQEIEVVNKNLHLFKNYKVIFPGSKVVNNCIDKYITHEFLSSMNILTPWSSLKPSSLINYPCIFKSRKGAGSKVLFEVNDEEEANYLSNKYKNGIFQELLLPKENEITCGVFRSKNGKTNSIQFQRLLNEGTTSWAKTVYIKEIDDLCNKVASELDLIGSMNIQLINTKSGPQIFEINPRFSSTVFMRHLLGFSDVIWSIKDSIGLSYEIPIINEDIEMVRTQKSEFLK